MQLHELPTASTSTTRVFRIRPPRSDDPPRTGLAPALACELLALLPVKPPYPRASLQEAVPQRWNRVGERGRRRGEAEGRGAQALQEGVVGKLRGLPRLAGDVEVPLAFPVEDQAEVGQAGQGVLERQAGRRALRDAVSPKRSLMSIAFVASAKQ